MTRPMQGELVSEKRWHRTIDGRGNGSQQFCLYRLNIPIGCDTADTGFKQGRLLQRLQFGESIQSAIENVKIDIFHGD